MVLFPGFVLALALALAGGGKLGRLADLRLRPAWIFYVAIGMQLVAFPAGLSPWSFGDRVATVISLSSYALLVVATIINARIPGIPLIGAGLACNVAAMAANSGHMPASASALAALGRVEHGVHNNSVSLAHPNLPWLIDRFHQGDAALPLEGVIGNGDSGGPLLIQDRGVWKLAGVASWKQWDGDLSDRKAGLYGVINHASRLAYYRPWIEQVLAAAGDRLPED